jgi:hypothetical protein
MARDALDEIESQFAQLPPEAQLGVLERLLHRVRCGLSSGIDSWEARLSEMAADPEVKRELSRINAEFTATEADGL